MRSGLLGTSILAAAIAIGAVGGVQAQTGVGAAGRHSMEGRVTKVDANKGWIDVKTPEGSMKLYFPPSSLQNVKSGDSVTVELAMTSATPKAK